MERYEALRAEAAVLLAEGRREAAAECARSGLAATADSFDLGGARMEADLLAAIVADCEAALASAPAEPA